MLDRARAEAEGIVRQAESDASALVERRGRMAEDKIAAAERAALDQVRAKAAKAAAAAAESLIREKLDAGADKALVDRTIGGWARADRSSRRRPGPLRSKNLGGPLRVPAFAGMTAYLSSNFLGARFGQAPSSAARAVFGHRRS